eukprot:5229711-Lingulodinium_polyedra.AAC.1
MVSHQGRSRGRQPSGAPAEGDQVSMSPPRPRALRLARAETTGPPRLAAAPSALTAATAVLHRCRSTALALRERTACATGPNTAIAAGSSLQDGLRRPNTISLAQRAA